MKFLSKDTRMKLYCVLFFLLLSFAMYLVIQFILPVIWPFLLAFFVAHYLHKCVGFMHKKLHFNNRFATLLVIGAVLIIVVSSMGILFVNLGGQIRNLIENFDIYVVQVSDSFEDICDRLGDTLGVDTDGFYDTIQVGMHQVAVQVSEGFMDNFMVNTKELAQGVMNFIILLVLLFTAIIYMTKDMEGIRSYLKNCYFSGEIAFVKNLVKTVFFAYLKTQFILICVISVICVVGLLILKNPYSLGIGILIGVADALPLFGVGAVLLPWTLFQLAMGDYFNAAMLFTMFLLSYMAREYLEPKIMGNTIGLHPVVTLIAVYVGYTLFGFLGMLIGPFAFVMISEIMKKVMET